MAEIIKTQAQEHAGGAVTQLCSIKEEKRIWSNLPSDAFRHNYYGAVVRYIDLGKRPSFQFIEAECRLSKEEPLADTPTIGKYFSDATNQHYQFVADEHYVVTASAEVDGSALENLTHQIKQKFPNLHFFSEQRNGSMKLIVPGINLPENTDILKRGMNA